jgi:hypothetical protein
MFLRLSSTTGSALTQAANCALFSVGLAPTRHSLYWLGFQSAWIGRHLRSSSFIPNCNRFLRLRDFSCLLKQFGRSDRLWLWFSPSHPQTFFMRPAGIGLKFFFLSSNIARHSSWVRHNHGPSATVNVTDTVSSLSMRTCESFNARARINRRILKGTTSTPRSCSGFQLTSEKAKAAIGKETPT